jgi:hypothetical protein
MKKSVFQTIAALSGSFITLADELVQNIVEISRNYSPFTNPHLEKAKKIRKGKNLVKKDCHTKRASRQRMFKRSRISSRNNAKK